jgi:hypothetical protein
MLLTIDNKQETFITLNKLVDQMRTFCVKKSNETDLEIIELIEKKLSPLHALTRLYINYRQQVANGGHVQYLENGYHTSYQNGCMSHISQEDDLRKKLLSLLNQHASVLGCSKELQVIIDTLGNLNITVDDEEFSENTCCSCNGSCSQEVSNSDFDANNEECSEPETVNEDCSDCDGTGRDNEAHNENYGKLTPESLIQCRISDDAVYGAFDVVSTAIANYALEQAK